MSDGSATNDNRRPSLTSTCSAEYHVLQLPVIGQDPTLRELIEFHLSRFPVPGHVTGCGRSGCDTWLAVVVCVFLACVVGVQSTRHSNSNRFELAYSSDFCPLRCTCFLLDSFERTSINVTCYDRRLTEVPSPIGINVGALDLSKNLIKNLPDGSFKRARFLKFLNLSHNRLSDIRVGAFKGLISLSHLHLHHNLLSSLHSDIFDDIPQLEHLDLNHNRLTTLTSDLLAIGDRSPCLLGCCAKLRLPQLQYLDLSHNANLGNNIRYDGFCSDKLRYLALRDTGLSNVQFLVDILKRNRTKSLAKLDLSGNRISFLTAKQLDVFLAKVDVLDLSSNPFRCDCSILSMVTWLKSHRTSIPRQWTLPTCRFPDSIRNVHVLSVSAGQVKVECDVSTKCRNLDHFAAEPGFDPSACPPVAAQMVTDLKIFTAARTTTRPLIPYDSIRTTYDPMLGWYTAMALMGMVLGLILCIVFDRIKKKYQNYRYRIWRRKVYEAMDVSGELADVGSQTDPEASPGLKRCDTSEYSSTTNEMIGSSMVDSFDKSFSCQKKSPLALGTVCNNITHAPYGMVSLSRGSLVRQTSSIESSGFRSTGHTHNGPTNCGGRSKRASCKRTGKSSRANLQRSQSVAVETKARPQLSRSSSAASDCHPETCQRAAIHRHHHHHHQNHQNRHYNTHRHHPVCTHQQTASRPGMMQRSKSTSTGEAAGTQRHSTLSRKPPLGRSVSTASSGYQTNQRTHANQSARRTDSVEQPTSGDDHVVAPETAKMRLSRNKTTADKRRSNYAKLRSESHSPSRTTRPTALELTVNPHRSNNVKLSSSHTIWETLTQVMRELKVTEINPNCPLHNRRTYQKLKILLQNNPDLTLAALVEELKTKY